MKKYYFVIVLAIITLAVNAQDVKWYTIEEAVELNKTEPRNLIIDVSTQENTRWNKKVNKVLRKKKIAPYNDSLYYAVKVDALEQKDIVIKYDTFRLKHVDSVRQQHTLATSLLDTNSQYPAIIILDEEFRVLYQLTGKLKPKILDTLLSYYCRADETFARREILSPKPIVKAPPKRIEQNVSEELKWYTIEEAVELNKTHPRKIVIDVYTDWCGWCKVMDKKTFKQPDVAKYLNENFYAVKFNAEQKEDVNILGTTFKFVSQGRRGSHQLAAALGASGYPYVVFLDEQMNIIISLPGYTKPQQFDKVINYISGEHYKNMKFEAWAPSYTSSIPSE